jgi:signal transduction histidine kinase
MVTGTSSGGAVPPLGPTRPRQGPFTRWPRASDALLAVIVFLLEVVGILGRAADEAGTFDLSMLGDVTMVTYLLLAVSSIALLWRRDRPLAVLATTLIASLVWDVSGLAGGASLAIFISLYGVGRYVDDQRTTLVAVAAAMGLALADDIVEGEDVTVMVASVAVVAAAWYVGRRVRGRGAYLALLEERAEYLEREQVAEAQRAVDEERTRIARELHDLVAHRVSMITVQAGAAQTVALSDPERAIRAMEAVEEAGREALDELRQVLGVLRSDDDRKGLAPMHGFAEIPGLVEDMRDAGMDVSLSSTGDPCDLPAKLDLASYRIAQEALTNVLKHAGPDSEAEVRLSTDDGMLTIEVTDRGSGDTTMPGSGNGLIGMRERAALLGGTFEAGPRPGGGFRISARLPIDRSTS